MAMQGGQTFKDTKPNKKYKYRCPHNYVSVFFMIFKAVDFIIVNISAFLFNNVDIIINFNLACLHR